VNPAALERHPPDGAGGAGGGVGVGGGVPPLVTVNVAEKYVSVLIVLKGVVLVSSTQHSALIWNEGMLTVAGTVIDAVHEPSAADLPLLLTFVLTLVPGHGLGVNPMMTFCPAAGQGVTDLMVITVPAPPLVGVTDMVADAGGGVLALAP
jgi:hypothetical protein